MTTQFNEQLCEQVRLGKLAIENTDKEIWKDIPNYEGYYQISNYGLCGVMNQNTNGWVNITDY